MPNSTVVLAPGGFAPSVALAFGALGESVTQVDASNPLPVGVRLPEASPSTSTPRAGTASVSTMVGPFVPQLARAIWLTLSGTWAGTAQLLRSTDGGATKLPLTIAGASWGSFTANGNEPVAEESDAAATYYLSITLTSGSVTYRVAQ